MRESGFYRVRFYLSVTSNSDDWEVARWDGHWWKRTGYAQNFLECEICQYGERIRFDVPATPPAEQPVTLEEVVRVLRAYRLEDPAINRAVLTIHPDERGYIDASAGQPFAAEWSDVAHLSRIIRAALANLDAPPKPSTFDAMRGVK